jgi:hypothetical protein
MEFLRALPASSLCLLPLTSMLELRLKVTVYKYKGYSNLSQYLPALTCRLTTYSILYNKYVIRWV